MSAGDVTQGRVRADLDSSWTPENAPKPGDFWKDGYGFWWGCAPSGGLVCLQKWTVTEHDDGTISASPSINILNPPHERWHGYLERGVWREV